MVFEFRSDDPDWAFFPVKLSARGEEALKKLDALEKFVDDYFSSQFRIQKKVANGDFTVDNLCCVGMINKHGYDEAGKEIEFRNIPEEDLLTTLEDAQKMQIGITHTKAEDKMLKIVKALRTLFPAVTLETEVCTGDNCAWHTFGGSLKGAGFDENTITKILLAGQDGKEYTCLYQGYGPSKHHRNLTFSMETLEMREELKSGCMVDILKRIRGESLSTTVGLGCPELNRQRSPSTWSEILFLNRSNIETARKPKKQPWNPNPICGPFL